LSWLIRGAKGYRTLSLSVSPDPSIFQDGVGALSASELAELAKLAGISARTHSEPDASVRIALVGAHLSGMPLNWQLTDRRAVLVEQARTASSYRLFALANTTPPKPGLLRVGEGEGSAIELEIWQMPLAEYGSFVALIATPLGIGTLQLSDGGTVQGFVCEAQGVQGATDISHFGGWRAYVQSLQAAAPFPPLGSMHAPASA
jgi:hypothetical protein